MKHIIKSIITIFFVLFLPAVGVADLPGVATDGGLQVGAITDPYWFNISGVLKLDQRTYFGDTAATLAPNYNAAGIGSYKSGAFIRDAGITLNGGVGKNYTYTLALDFDPREKEVGVDDAYVTFWMFKDLLPNLTFSVGQVVPGFCLNCAESSKWIPFMERNMGTSTFGPRQGMGVAATTYNNNYSLTLAITQQPKMGTPVRNVYNQTIKMHDLLQLTGRLTVAPISEPGKVLQFGVSAHSLEHSNTGLRFRAVPEMRSGNSTTLLDTAIYGPSNSVTLIAAKDQMTYDVELLGIYGPWSGELEYQHVHVKRGSINNVVQGPNLNFSGYHGQVSYILTGETRPLKYSNGTLGQIKPIHCYGAVEVSARYSFVTLNSGDIYGGLAHNTTGSVGWYLNNNLKILAEYVYSKQHRNFPTYRDHRHVSSVGARLQVVF